MADTASSPTRSNLPHRKQFTYDDLLAMMKAGVIDDGGPEELLDGEIWVGSRRKRFMADEVDAMIRAGIVAQDAREELLDGDIWDMAAEGGAHINLKTWLNRLLVKWAPQDVGVACDTTLRLTPTHTPSPDFYLFPAAGLAADVRAEDLLLVIEIADTSTKKDLEIKGPKYREYGVREYWVIDLAARVTHVHRLDGAWPEAPPVPFDSDLSPSFAPDLRVRMSASGV